ncbi:acyltransferase family protein [Pedobacter gandavensis]|uniref:Acyltransferase family protein n=1 Tax=Pedobacter gandavensis TaxID=2679963 RepID=A0ABR6ERR5_9SPHI|nr:acyltransferase [Pedobacter gandavensis]MBB2147892.1 acyltransferase family protein [Pedobacter gandavensis]
MNAKTLSPELLKTKEHFHILDGLRGVAAVAIVIFHFMEVVYIPAKNFIGHGFLAVDFFFCLSGFVIGYAYDDRIGKMGMATFLKTRLIRLHPLVVLGSVLGLLAFLFDPFSLHSELYSAGRIALVFLSSILMIPFPVVSERYFNLFSFNAPAWSLFWEYIANFVYVLVLYKATRNLLLILTILAGIAICYIGYTYGALLGGWSGETFWHGCARISYSFLAGLLIFRSKWIIRTKLGFVGLSVLLLLAFLMPDSKWNWITEPLVVLIYFPLLICLGAGAKLQEGLKKLCVFSGNISYPLYMTHYMVLWIFAGYYTAHKPDTSQLVLIIIGGTALLVAFAYVVMKFYDIPVRKYLMNKLKKAS